jgi:hypothetical protein
VSFLDKLFGSHKTANSEPHKTANSEPRKTANSELPRTFTPVTPKPRGPGEAELCAALRDDSPQARCNAARELANYSSGRSAGALHDRLKDGSAEVRLAAVNALASIWKRDQRAGNPACPYLSDAVGNKDEAVRVIAKEAMRHYIGNSLIEIHHKDTGAFITALILESFRESRINGLDLSESDLRGHDFERAFTQGVNFSAADLRGVNFQGGNSANAIFKRADLRCANLASRNLWGADFSEADLCGAILEDCQTTDTVFAGARYDATTVWPTGFDPVERGAIKSEQ